MALHIRDFRTGDTTELAKFRETGRVIGEPQPVRGNHHILVGLHRDQPIAAAWLQLIGEQGRITTIVVPDDGNWQSIARELIAEAGLWFGSRGARSIVFSETSQDTKLQSMLRHMGFAIANGPSMTRGLQSEPQKAFRV